MGQSNFKYLDPTQKLILPLGLISSDISGEVLVGELGDFLIQLSHTSFSGYLRVQPQPEEASVFSQGLLIVREGAVIEARVYLKQTAELIKGETALEYLNRANFSLLAVEVEPETVEGWRALLADQKTYSGVRVTPLNYQNLFKSFASSKRSGAIYFYQGQIEFYALIYQGNLGGFFRPESESNTNTAYLQEIEELPQTLITRGQAHLDVYLTPPAQTLRLRQEHLSLEQIELIDRTFQAMIHLTGELATPEKVTEHLQNVLELGSQSYLPLQHLTVTKEPEGDLPRLWLERTATKIKGMSKQQVLVAFDYLFEEFLKSYCYPIGPEIFHTMAARAISPKDAEELLDMGLHLDFLSGEIHPIPPGANYLAEPASDNLNPFDF